MGCLGHNHIIPGKAAEVVSLSSWAVALAALPNVNSQPGSKTVVFKGDRTSANRPAWCENSLGGGSIFMVSGWPGKGHGSLLKTPLRLFRVSFKGSKPPPLQCFG